MTTPDMTPESLRSPLPMPSRRRRLLRRIAAGLLAGAAACAAIGHGASPADAQPAPGGSASGAPPAVQPAQPPVPAAAPTLPLNADGTVTIPGFGITLRPPTGWTIAPADQMPQGVLLRLLAAAPNPDGLVLDVTINQAREGDALTAVRDRAAEFYRRQIKDSTVNGPADARVGDMAGFELAVGYKDSQGRVSTLVERTTLIGDRIYSLRLAARGEQTAVLARVVADTSATVVFDRKVTQPADPTAYANLVKRAKALDLRRVLPAEQMMLAEFTVPAQPGQPAAAPRNVGYVYRTFQKAKFLNTEGWYLRFRSQQDAPDGTKVRETGWAFVSEDWSREQWSFQATRVGADGRAEVLFTEEGKREADKVTLTFKTPEKQDGADSFTVGADYLPLAVEPAILILAAREGRGEFACQVHAPGSRLVGGVLSPAEPRLNGTERVAVLVRRPAGQTNGPTLLIAESGHTVAEQMPDGPTLRGVDKAALLRAYPDAVQAQ